jgi:hypothetical protein
MLDTPGLSTSFPKRLESGYCPTNGESQVINLRYIKLAVARF